jgi:predicted transcriptional regulator
VRLLQPITVLLVVQCIVIHYITLQVMAQMARVTSIRMSEDLAAQLDQLAKALDRPRAWLIEQALVRYIEEESWQVAAVTEALAAYRSGKAVLRSHDEVMDRLAAKIHARTDDADSLA